MSLHGKWYSPHDWLRYKITHGSLSAVRLTARLLINLIDADDIRRVFRPEMNHDGYFDPLPESPDLSEPKGE